MSVEFIRIPFTSLESEFNRVLLKNGFGDSVARTCAGVFAHNSLDGVYSHGINRFAKFVELVRKGHIIPNEQAVCKSGTGNLEQWDGQSGPGPVNALLCTTRAMELATHYGMGCVALANTNHWLRGGTYGWHAAKAGFVFIGWSNTLANMPAWGAVNARLGNNPLVIAVPHENEAIVLDMAMSQYSYGALEMYEMKSERLPVPGGFDTDGNLTQDPVEIRKSHRPLPIGYWKGAGLSLLLDILATILSGGLSTAAITRQGGEYRLSQLFMAIDISKLANFTGIANTLYQILADYSESLPDASGKKVRYPGERVIEIRAENTALGIPVLRRVWDKVREM